jgi:hypothetical protein
VVRGSRIIAAGLIQGIFIQRQRCCMNFGYLISVLSIVPLKKRPKHLIIEF